MKITALQPIRHDQEDFAIGDELDLSDEQAQALIDVGAAEANKLASSTTNKTAKAAQSGSKGGAKK